MVRVRYKRQNNKLISVKPILCNTKFANIVLSIDEMKYEIVDIKTKEVLAYGISDSLYGLKKMAKISAKNIGAKFLDEVRNTHEQRKLIIEATNN